MLQLKTGMSSRGNIMHYSVGAVIEQNGKYLLIDRSVEPLGFAGIAGHIDRGETPAQALQRELQEESGLRLKNAHLVYEEELDWNWCSKGIKVHYWYLYKCTVTGRLKQNKRETRSIGWYTREEIKNLTLEPVWAYWFRKLKVV